ncbi:MAG: hypothetical protein AAFV88_07540 [Planctomycetota bacterium]
MISSLGGFFMSSPDYNSGLGDRFLGCRLLFLFTRYSEEQPLSSRRANQMKWCLSILLAYHFLAVLLPPMAFQTSGPGGRSPLLSLLIQPFQGYGQFLYLDRGYAFFAPDPGPSHLIQVAVETSDGKLKESLSPNIDEQWPRLLYHRHFMLAEYLNEVYAPPGPPNDLFEADPIAARLWDQQRGRYEHVRQSYVDHLSHVHDGQPAVIRRIEHAIPLLSEYLAEPIELNDPRLYFVLMDQPVISDEIAPAVNSEVIPAPGSQGNTPGSQGNTPGSQGNTPGSQGNTPRSEGSVSSPNQTDEQP